jgi:hypothetical protein
MSDFVSEIIDSFDTIAEMTTDAAAMIPLSPEIVAAVTEGDDDPKFGTFVIESGWSKQKRYWGPDLFSKVAEQINNSDEPIVGYMGHIRPDDDAYVFPDIQMQWLKAKVTSAGDKARLVVKAYLMPEGKARDYIRRGIAKTVSWRGSAITVPYQGGVRVQDFDIESIDLSRPRKAGMSARLAAVTSEMTEGRSEVKPEEIAALQENELRAHNPGLVKQIEDSAAKPHKDKVAEMESAADDAKKDSDLLGEIRKLFGMDENADVLDVLGKAVSQISAAGATVKKALLDDVLGKKFKDDEKVRKLVGRVLATEMESYELQGDDEKDAKAVSEMVNKLIDEDEDLKSLVSEMDDNSGTGKELNGKQDDRSGNREIKDGFETSNIRVRKAV